VFRAVHSGSVGLKVTEQDAEVQRPPVPATLPLVVARGETRTAPAAALLRASGTDVDHHRISLFVEVNRLDDRLSVDTEQFAPYVDSEHAILLASISGPLNSPKPRRGLALLASGAAQGTHGLVTRA